MISKFFLKLWFDNSSKISYLWLLLEKVYAFLLQQQRKKYVTKQQNQQLFNARIPVIVVGNIIVGGSGKTPVIAHIAQLLQQNNFKIGLISKGYGRCSKDILEVLLSSSATEAGDEPLMLKTKNPDLIVFVGDDRVLALQAMISKYNIDIVLSDDGLQHLNLQRNLEICVINTSLNLQNKHLLPAGPFRENEQRLANIDIILSKGKVVTHFDNEFNFIFKEKHFVNLLTKERVNLSYFEQKKTFAIAGIAHPELFFKIIKDLNIDSCNVSFSDHHRFEYKDLEFVRDDICLMTEKDAIKCKEFAKPNWYFLEMETMFPTDFENFLLTKIKTQEVKQYARIFS